MLQEKFLDHINRSQLFGTSDRLLIAVSGGVDSVVLAQLCHDCSFNFEIAHVNFSLRGEESDLDELFVRSIADRHGVQLYSTKFDTASYAAQNKLSVQVAARNLRYNWFAELTKEHGHTHLLTAHHADDNIETSLMNFFRGTGIRGLRGIPQRSGNIVRPLLPFTKGELVAYAREYGLQWREDLSNTSDKYSRNFLRINIIPLITKIYPDAEKNLLENTTRFAEAELLYEQALAQHQKKMVLQKGDELHLPVNKLRKTEPLRTILYEIVRKFGFTPGQMPDVLHLLEGPHGKLVLSPTHRLMRNRDWLVLTPLKRDGDGTMIVIEEGDHAVTFPPGELQLQKQQKWSVEAKHADEELLDMRKIEYPLILRRARPGDYFYPLGLGKKKKVARFLIDRKLSRSAKENIWVLETGKRICWIIGHRIDDRFKLDNATKSILKISWVRNEDRTERR